jgi:lipase ATG15
MRNSDDQHSKQHTTLAPIPGPNVSDRPTVINLAKMASDAYIFAPTQPDWLNTTLKFNYSSSFGWSDKGLRGHVFTDRWNRTVIVSFKGTTIDPREKWTTNDRINDNILFSCCCGDQRPDPYPYAPVCGCRTDVYTCNATCITQELGQKDRYYSTALAVMYNVTARFPSSDFWVVGHSMGGSMASLMGLTFGFPVVTFEAPGELLPARRLGLTKNHGPGAHHFGNTADPVFMGACNGWTSSCGIAGYAFESQCFTGKRCVYDTVGDYGWHLNIANHRINYVITEVLEKYNNTATCEEDSECVDCFNWKSR